MVVFIVKENTQYTKRLFIYATGNSVSLVVLLGRTFRKSSLSVTLGALAVVDSAVLSTALSRQWILSLTGEDIDIRTLTGVIGCKIHFFLTYYLITPVYLYHLLPLFTFAPVLFFILLPTSFLSSTSTRL